MPWSYRKNRLHYWRCIRWYTQKELAQKLGVSPRTVSSWEADTTVPSTDHALKIAKILRVNVRELWPFEPLFEPPTRTDKKKGAVE